MRTLRWPGSSEAGAHVGGGDCGALLDESALWRQVRNPDGRIQVVVLLHPSGSDGVTVTEESAVDRARLGDGRRGQAKLASCEDGAFFAASVVIAKVDDPAIGAHESINDMCVRPTAFDVKDACARLVLKAEFALKMLDESADRSRIVPTRWWVDVDMIEWPVCPTVRSTGDQAAQLSGEVCSGEVTGFDKPDLLAHFLEE